MLPWRPLVTVAADSLQRYSSLFGQGHPWLAWISIEYITLPLAGRSRGVDHTRTKTDATARAAVADARQAESLAERRTGDGMVILVSGMLFYSSGSFLSVLSGLIMCLLFGFLIYVGAVLRMCPAAISRGE